MAVLFDLTPRSGTVQRRAISPGASMGLGVLIGAIVVAGLATFVYFLWRRHRWHLHARGSRGQRVAHLDAHSVYFPYEDDAHAHEKFPISPFVAHHAELMVERPVLHITHNQSPVEQQQQSGSPMEGPATAALDHRGRWNGRMPRSPSSADALMHASPSPHSAGSGPPSGSGSAAARSRARTPPLALALELNRVRSDPAQIRQSIGGTAEVTIGIPAPVLTRDESRREWQRRRNAPVSIVTAEDALQQTLSTSAATGAHPLPSSTSPSNATPSRHPFSDGGNSPSRSRLQQDAPASGSGRRSSIEKRPMLVMQNATTPTTPAPRYSLWGRLSSIGGLLHAPPPPTALPEYNTLPNSQNAHPRGDEGLRSGAIAMAPYAHAAASDSQGRLVPPGRSPPPAGPPPMPPAGSLSSSGTSGGRRR